MRREKPLFTLGIEEEFQLVDPVTRELSPRNAEIINAGRPLLGDNIKPEMLMSCVETVTPVCKDIKEAREHLHFNRRTLSELAFKHGLAIAASGTHPFSIDLKERI